MVSVILYNDYARLKSTFFLLNLNTNSSYLGTEQNAIIKSLSVLYTFCHGKNTMFLFISMFLLHVDWGCYLCLHWSFD